MEQVVYKTKSGTLYPIEVGYKVLNYDDIFFDPITVEKLCKKGCRNYCQSGGCPPYAPKFDKIVSNKHRFILLIAKFYSKYKTEKVKACKNRAIHWKFQDAILARFCDSLGRKIVMSSDSFFLGTGYCMGCPGQKCSFKLGEACRKPEKRTYSMEATGINVVKTVRNAFNIKFYWYNKYTSDVPYMMKSILLVADESSLSSIIDKIENIVLGMR